MKDLPNVQPINMQPRVNMSKGNLVSAAIAAGRKLPGRIKDLNLPGRPALSNKILGKDKKTLKDMLKEEGRYYGFDNADDFLKYIDKNAIEASGRRVPFEGFGFEGKPANLYQVFKNREIRMSQNRNIPGTASLNDRLRRGTENAIIGGGLLGGAAVTDATQGFTEQASMQNMMLNSPEQLGKDLAGMKIGIEKVIQLASQKAQEIGAPITEYVGRAQRSYEDEMEAERMQQIDAEEGLKNVSLLMAGGGEADSDDFPDLSGDGQITRKDILIGQGVKFKAEGDEVILSIDQKINNELKARGYPMDVIADLTAREKLNDVMRKNQNLLSPEEISAYASSNRQDFSQSYIPKPVMGLTRKYAEGDEVMMMEESEMMAPSGDEIEASLMEVQGMQPEMQQLDQFVQMVIEMIQAGASEAEVIESLRQAGLDDEDIAAVFQAVMETMQGSMEQGGIDAELAQLS
jgi:hypothetical protein